MMIDEYSEVERKYDVAPDAGLPDLTGVPGVARLLPPVTLEQSATYFDTSDLRLLAAQITLRRRTGGLDDGWHLKLPREGDRREEVRAPLGEAASPPAELLDRVRVVVRDAPVAPTAVVVTHRSIHRLVDDAHVVLAELCDDRVTATAARDPATVERWREWELELVDAPTALLDLAEPVLVAAGARRAAAHSKVERVLTGSLHAQPAPHGPGGLSSHPSAGELLLAYVAEHVDRLRRQEQLLRSGDQEGVHRLRVAARRLRSALTTYAPVLEPGSTVVLRGELRWFGGVLSEARDAQVLGERLVALVDEQPTELVLGPVVERITAELQRQLRTGRAHADEVLDGSRHFRLLEALEAFVAAPPCAEAAGVGADQAVPGLVEAELRRVRKRHHGYRRTLSQTERDLALHEVRKAAKRLRYAAETAQPVFHHRARRLAAGATSLQELLGEHQDSVVSRRTLREIALRAHEAGENTFTFGLLHAAEERRAAELESRYLGVVAELPHDLGEWLSGR